jgi:TPR repeat protein
MTLSGRFGERSARLLARITVGLALAGVAATTAWALDPDMAFQVRARKAEVTPLCTGLLAQKQPLSTQQTYQKALCLLYGINGPEQVERALDLLRQLAPGLVEAQLALADALQQGGAAQQDEALQWYARAAAAGDVRATARHARLQQRVQAARAAYVPKPVGDADPFSDPFANSDSLPPGYHCHFYGLGKKVCHGSGMD